MTICKLFLPKIKCLYKWRLNQLFLKKIDEITRNDYINSFYPDIQEIIIETIKKSSSEVRELGAKVYCRLIVNLPKFEQRKHSMKMFCEEFNKEGCNESRLQMVSLFSESMKVFSRPALRFYIFPIMLIYHQYSISVKLALAKILPEINEAIDPSDEVMLKKLITLKNNLESCENKHVQEIFHESSSRIQLKSRQKQHIIEVTNHYNNNRSLEESYLLNQYDETNLEDIYKKESGQFVSKFSSSKSGAKVVSRPFGVNMKKLSDPKEITEKEEPPKYGSKLNHGIPSKQ